MLQLVPLEGVVCVQLKTRVIFPQHHVYFSEAYAEGWQIPPSCKREEVDIWSKTTKQAGWGGQGGTDRPDILGPFWESENVFPNMSKYQVDEFGMQKGSGIESKERQKNKIHVKASVEKHGILKLAMYHVANQKMHNIKYACRARVVCACLPTC